MGTFSPLAFSVQNFSSDETISHEARISATFIDWVDNKWRIGIKTDAGKLLQLVQGLREEIKVFKIP
jgi:hypothetical protein